MGYDIEAAYPEKLEQLTKEDGKRKVFTTYFKMERLSDFENLIKRNGLEFMTSIKYDMIGNTHQQIIKIKKRNLI